MSTLATDNSATPTRLHSGATQPLAASSTCDRVDEYDEATPASLFATRKVAVVVDQQAIAELRTSDPRTAERLDAALTEMPCAGDMFQGFALVLELGHGAFGRVFLARQRVLADRLVVLKIAADLHGESQHLARLQHTNIVPIHSEHHAGNLHAVCMPYFGSATLADVCKGLSSNATLPTSGKQLISTLFNRRSTVRGQDDRSHVSSQRSSEFPATPMRGALLGAPAGGLVEAPGNLTKIEQMSYVDAVLWMASRLADGLAHAHERGIIHRDLKPANVLLCDDGQPMLLDFNLAQDVKSSSAFAVAQMGGTPPYMAPEQLIAYRDGTGGFDSRGDLYALGLIIYHLLTGRHAFPIRRGRSLDILPKMIADRQGPPPGLRCFNRAVSPAVESIVRHCLEVDPARRYASARQLADDIERQRANLPLKYAPEPSLWERAVKWSRRHPRLASPTMASVVIAAILLVCVSISVQQSLKSRTRDLEERREQALAHYHAFQSDYHLAQDLLITDDPAEISQGLQHGEKALHDYHVAEQAEWLEQPLVKELAPPDRARLQAEVGEIAFMMARAIHFQPHADGDQARRMNELAERNLDDNAKPALNQQRAALAPKNMDRADYQRLRQLLENAAGLNTHGRFLLACEHAAQGRHQEALRILDRVVVENSDDFGAWSLKARCHQMLDQDVEAIAAYGTAIALRPSYARSFVYRAAVLFTQQNRAPQALQDLEQALKVQPNLLEAHIDRGLVLFALGRPKEALHDLDWALERDQAPARLWFIRSRVRQVAGDLEGSERDRQCGLRTEPTDPLSWVARGMAKLSTDAEGALADFIKAEESYPRCIEALNNQAYVYAVKLKKPADAIAALDRLLANFPDNPRALGYRAILLARSGRTEEAVTSARLLAAATTQPEHIYRSACALAIASEKNPAVKSESLRLLASALARGWGHDILDTDHDLDAVRDTTQFKNFTGYTRIMRLWSKPTPRSN